jgi:hypothetical protein
LYTGIDVELPAEFVHCIYPFEAAFDRLPSIPGSFDATQFKTELLNGRFSGPVLITVAAATAFDKHLVYVVEQFVKQAAFVDAHARRHAS